MVHDRVNWTSGWWVVIGGTLGIKRNSVGVFPSTLVGDSMFLKNSDDGDDGSDGNGDCDDGVAGFTEVDDEKRQFVGESMFVIPFSYLVFIIQDLR